MKYYDKFIAAQINTSKGIEYEVKPGSILEGVTPESDRLNEVADEVGAVIIQEVSFYKQTLLPEIKQVFENVNGSIELEKKKLMKKESIELVTVNIPKDILVEDLSFNENLDYMENSDVTLESRTAETIREIIGKENNFLDHLSDSKLNNVWELYFKDFNTTNRNISSAASVNTLTMANVNDIFIIYYILKGMMGSDYAEGLGSLDNLRNNRTRYFNYIKKEISLRIARIKMAIANNVIVLNVTEINTTPATVVIVEDMFLDFKEAGGDVDSLHGLALGTKISYLRDIASIVENKQALSDTYKEHHKGVLAKVTTSLNHTTHTALVSLITRMVRGKQDELEKYDEVKDFINGLPLPALTNPIIIIEDIYSNILYKNANLKTFLSHVRLYGENTTSKHAITLAIADMVATFLVNSLDIIKVD